MTKILAVLPDKAVEEQRTFRVEGSPTASGVKIEKKKTEKSSNAKRATSTACHGAGNNDDSAGSGATVIRREVFTDSTSCPTDVHSRNTAPRVKPDPPVGPASSYIDHCSQADRTTEGGKEQWQHQSQMDQGVCTNYADYHQVLVQQPQNIRFLGQQAASAPHVHAPIPVRVDQARFVSNFQSPVQNHDECRTQFDEYGDSREHAATATEIDCREMSEEHKDWKSKDYPRAEYKGYVPDPATENLPQEVQDFIKTSGVFMCYICDKVRSRGFHLENSLPAGLINKSTICGKCEKDEGIKALVKRLQKGRAVDESVWSEYSCDECGPSRQVCLLVVSFKSCGRLKPDLTLWPPFFQPKRKETKPRNPRTEVLATPKSGKDAATSFGRRRASSLSSISSFGSDKASVGIRYDNDIRLAHERPSGVGQNLPEVSLPGGSSSVRADAVGKKPREGQMPEEALNSPEKDAEVNGWLKETLARMEYYRMIHKTREMKKPKSLPSLRLSESEVP